MSTPPIKSESYPGTRSGMWDTVAITLSTPRGMTAEGTFVTSWPAGTEVSLAMLNVKGDVWRLLITERLTSTTRIGMSGSSTPPRSSKDGK